VAETNQAEWDRVAAAATGSEVNDKDYLFHRLLSVGYPTDAMRQHDAASRRLAAETALGGPIQPSVRMVAA